MRILINAVSAKAGGGITYLVNLLKYLPKIMPEDEFLCVIQDIELPSEVYTHNNLDIRVIKQASESVLKRYWWENTGLLKLCKRWKADLLYCVANMIPLFSPIFFPTIMMLQNVAPITPKTVQSVYKTEGIKQFMKMLMNTFLTLYSSAFSKKIFVLSEHSNSLIKKWVPFCKTEIVHHGISPIFMNYKKSEKDDSEGYFVFVSNIYVYKGLEYIIEAYKTNPKLPKIYIIGKAFDYKYEKEIKALTAINNLEAKIIFLGAVPYSELPKWYSNAIANVFPSWCESFGCGIIEAQACGCLVVGMNTATLPEFCGKTGIVVKPFDGKSLAEGMQKAIELRKDSTLEARLLKYSKEFTWEKAMFKHRDCFRESYSN